MDRGAWQAIVHRTAKSRTRLKLCRKGDPFQGPRVGSCITLGNELSEETHELTKQELLLEKGAQA